MKKEQKMSSIPTRDVFILKDIVNTILEDDDLRRSFNKCVASTAEMKRAVKGLNKVANESLDKELAAIDSCCGKKAESLPEVKPPDLSWMYGAIL